MENKMTSKEAYELAVAYNQLAVKLQIVKGTNSLSLENLVKAQYFSDLAMMTFLTEIPLVEDLQKSVANILADTSITISENIRFFEAKKA